MPTTVKERFDLVVKRSANIFSTIVLLAFAILICSGSQGFRVVF